MIPEILTLDVALPRLERLDWKHEPRQSLATGLSCLLNVDHLPWVLAEHLRHEGVRSGSAHRVHELITRTDILICGARSGFVDLWLHANRAAITPSTAIRPNITTRGHFQGTIVIAGRLVRTKYQYDGPKHQEEWFNREYLRPVGREEHVAGSSFIIGPDEIYQWEEIEARAVTLTIDVNYGARPYRVYTRQMSHYACEFHPPRAQRMAEVANRLQATSRPPQPR